MCAQLVQSAKDKKIQKLLAKVQTMDLGTSSFWKPDAGRSTIRILPPIGTMEYFFAEVGQHYLGNTYFYCPTHCNGGDAVKFPCPICELNEALYAAGEKEAASEFRVGRKWYMNIVERGPGADGKPHIFAAGQSIMQVVISLIGDDDYGDISDPQDGWDIKLDKVGEGKETKYSALPAAKSSPLGTPDSIKESLALAKDISAYVAERLMSYDDLAKKSGVDVYIEGSGEESVEDDLTAEVEEEEGLVEEEEEEVKPTQPLKASTLIASRLKLRSSK